MKNAIKNIVASLQVGLIVFQIAPAVSYAQITTEENFSVDSSANGFTLDINGQTVNFTLQSGDFDYAVNATDYGASEVLDYRSGEVVYEINAGDLSVSVEDGALIFADDDGEVFTRPMPTLRDTNGDTLGSASYELLAKNTKTTKTFDETSAPENRDGYAEGPDGYWYKEGVAYEYRGGTYVRVSADWNNPSGVEGEVFGERDFAEYLTEETAEVLNETESIPAEEAEAEITEAEPAEAEVIETETEEVIEPVEVPVEEITEETQTETEQPVEETETENAEESVIEDAVVWLFGFDSAYAQEEITEETETAEEIILPIENPLEDEIVTFEQNTNLPETETQTAEIPAEIAEDLESAIVDFEQDSAEAEITTEPEVAEEIVVEPETAEEITEEVAEVLPEATEVETVIVNFEKETTTVTYTVRLNLGEIVPAQIVMPTVVLADKFIQTEAKTLVCANPAQYAEMFNAINSRNASEEYIGLDFSADSIREGEAIIKTSERELALPVAEVSDGGDLLAKAQNYLAEKKTALESESDHFLVDVLGEQVVTSTQVAKKMEESLAGSSAKINSEKFVTNSNGRTLETSFNENSDTIEKAITINNNYSFDVTLRGLESYCQSVYAGENGDTKVYASEHDLITYTQSANGDDNSLKEWVYAFAPNSADASRYDWDFSLNSNSGAWLEFTPQADGSVMLYYAEHTADGDALTALVQIDPLVYFTAQGVQKQASYVVNGSTLSIAINEDASAYPLLIDPTFTLVTNATGFSGRSNHTSVVFNNKIWVMGGYDGSNDLSDVWSSVDGNTWVRSTAAAGWHGRSFHSSVVFNNKIWVIGGDYLSGSTAVYTSDIWSSVDGANWVREVSSAPFGARSGQSAIVFNNKIWVIGGRTSDGTYMSDVWSSVDGVNWVRSTANAGFSGRTAFETVSYNNKIWVIGGFNGSNQYSDVWSSADGVNWVRATASMTLGARDSHTAIVYDDKIWLLGGYYNGTFKNDVWYTTNGSVWTQQAFGTIFSARDNHQSVIFNNKIWVIGGRNGSRLSDSWSSVLDETAPVVTDISANSVTAPYGSTVRFYVNATDTGGSGLNTTNAVFYLRTLGAGAWDRVNGAVMSWDAVNSRYYYDVVLNDIYNTGYRAMATVYDNIGYSASRDENPTEFVIENTPAPISNGTAPADSGSVNGNGANVHFTTAAVVDADGQAVEYLFRVATGADAETGVVCDSGWQAGTTYDCNPGAGTLYWHVYTRDTIETTTPDYVYTFVNNYTPIITDNQAGDDTVRNAAGTTYDVDCADATLGIDIIQYSLGTASGLTDIAGWNDIWTGDGASYTTDWTVNTALLAQGRNYVNVRCTDLGGLTAQADGAFYVEWDTVAPPAPVVSSTSPTNDTTPTWTWVSGGADGNGNYRYKLDDNDMSAGTTSTALLTYTSGVLAEGNHTLYVQERDAVGNWSATGSFTVEVDTTAPNVTLTYSANPAPAGAMTITATFDDTLAGTPQIAIDQQGTTDLAATDMTATADPLVWTYNYTVQTATGGTYIDGLATVTISNASDDAGNALNATNNPTFTIDTTSPVVSASSPANGVLLPMSPNEFSFTYSDNAVDVASIAVMIDLTGDADYDDVGEDLTGSCTTLNATQAVCPLGVTLLPGRYQLYFTIEDTAGNTTTLEYPFWVDNFTFTVEHLSADLGVLSSGAGSTTADDTEHTKITITTYGAGVDVDTLVSGQLTNGTDNVPWHADNVAVAGTGSAYRVKETAAGAFGNYFNFNTTPQVATKAKLADGTYGALLTYTFYVEHYARTAGSESSGNYAQDITFNANVSY